MNKKCYRFFGGLLVAQANWLNKMANKGYRLLRTEKLLYEFEPCIPGKYQYQVEFVGQKTRESADDYAHFLEDCGYRTMFKNINLDYSVGKAVWRPWAEPGGQIATNATTFNHELLIVEREANGNNFELHTTYEDKMAYYRNLRRPWLFMLLVSAVLGIAMKTWVWGIFAVISLAGVLVYQIELVKLQKQSESKEW